MIRKNCDENIRPYNFDPMNYVIESGQFSIEFVLYKMRSVQFWSVELYVCSLYVFFRRLHEAPRDGGAHAQDDWVEYTVPPGRWLHSGSNSPSSSSFYHHHHLLLLLTWSIHSASRMLASPWYEWYGCVEEEHITVLLEFEAKCSPSLVTLWLCITRIYSLYMCSLHMSRHVVIRYC